VKLQTSYEAFSRAVRTAVSIAPSRSPRPVLQSLYLKITKKRTEIIASDLETGIRCEVIGAAADEAAEFLLPAQRIAGIVREASGEKVEIEYDRGKVKAKIGKSRFSLQTAEASDFPEVPEFGERKALEFEAEEFCAAVARVIFATAREGTRYAINGILFSAKGRDVEFVGTDGRRLARVRRRISGGPAGKTGGILSVKFLAEAQKLASEQEEATVRMAVDENQALVRVGVNTLSGTLIEGRFPAYEEVIPKEKGRPAVLGRAELESALRQAKVLTTEETRSVTMTFSPGKAKISSQTPDVGEADLEIEAGFEGEPLTVAFNPDYLTDVLRVLGGEKITLELLGSSRPGVIQEGKAPNAYTYVVMPVKLRG